MSAPDGKGPKMSAIEETEEDGRGLTTEIAELAEFFLLSLLTRGNQAGSTLQTTKRFAGFGLINRRTPVVSKVTLKFIRSATG